MINIYTYIIHFFYINKYVSFLFCVEKLKQNKFICKINNIAIFLHLIFIQLIAIRFRNQNCNKNLAIILIDNHRSVWLYKNSIMRINIFLIVWI